MIFSPHYSRSCESSRWCGADNAGIRLLATLLVGLRDHRDQQQAVM